MTARIASHPAVPPSLDQHHRTHWFLPSSPSPARTPTPSTRDLLDRLPFAQFIRTRRTQLPGPPSSLPAPAPPSSSMQEPSYATFAPAAFAAPIDSLVPAQVPQHSTADFDSIKRTFASSSSELEKKQRYASVPANHQYAPHTQSPSREVQQQMLLQQEGGLVGGTGGYANGYGAQQQVVSNGYLGGYGAGAPSFVPQAQVAQMQAQVQAAAAAAAHQQHLGGSQGGNSPVNGFSHPSSPYLSPNPNAIPFGSPSSQSNGGFPLPGQPQSYNGSQYSGQFDTMPSSPNPYAQGPYNNYNGLGFAGPPFMGMPMAPGMMAMGSPSLGGQMPLQQQGMGGGYNMPYQMMSPVLGMAPNSLTSVRPSSASSLYQY